MGRDDEEDLIGSGQMTSGNGANKTSCSRTRIVETNDEICIGHLRAFSPRTMMKTMVKCTVATNITI